jgi:hypothetical protein
MPVINKSRPAGKTLRLLEDSEIVEFGLDEPRRWTACLKKMVR